MPSLSRSRGRSRPGKAGRAVAAHVAAFSRRGYLVGLSGLVGEVIDDAVLSVRPECLGVGYPLGALGYAQYVPPAREAALRSMLNSSPPPTRISL